MIVSEVQALQLHLDEDRLPHWASSILLARLERAKTLMKENGDE